MSDTDFLLISDPKIWAMPVKECHEPLIDLKDLHFQISLNRASFYAGYTKVRQSVATKLVAAQQYLPQGITFLFSEGHRPLSIQRLIYREYYAHLADVHPEWDEHILKREVTKYVAPPEDVPPHSTGGAIDITLIDANGQELDMGSVLDETPDKNQNRNFTHAAHITDAARANRSLLIYALSRVGFVNYPAEWWHWSYGDKYWAYHANQPCSIYGSIE
ncbi:M15 family metallopeptidase [Aquicella lusitana]|uniref:D-alanyl-D-alanine dipeptidase n=1 Tax=Aquicella lusitana TaxID=254246 RepID=A0A370GB26_9COXI|nr:M15 family metallopeptidase [Aquicella lusitana]RDI40958.1 D-alanyl-D-alanine dipeptidase [Aquicella lusitana]VVC73637.1 D-alanyl-D-alanine dipeptidase [Aquicella lusitana]